MKKRVSIRYQQVGDARRFVEILNSPGFIYFPAKPESIREEKEFLRRNAEWRRKKEQFNFTILLGDKIVGAVGVHIDAHRPYCAEIGYFVDEAHWGKGIAVDAVRLAEQFAFDELDVMRIEINMLKANKASERVAVKSGCRKEGIARRKLLLNGDYLDCYVYAKTRD